MKVKQDTLTHIAQVAAANIAAYGVTLVDVNEIIKFISLAAAASYTIYRFYKDVKNNDKK